MMSRTCAFRIHYCYAARSFPLTRSNPVLVVRDHSRKVCQFNFSTNFDEELFSKTGRNFFHFNSFWNFSFVVRQKDRVLLSKRILLESLFNGSEKHLVAVAIVFMFPDSANKQILIIFQFYLHSITYQDSPSEFESELLIGVDLCDKTWSQLERWGSVALLYLRMTTMQCRITTFQLAGRQT